MSDRANNDLAALLTPAPSKGVQFSQGRVLTWDRTELRNTIEWRGITLTDVPMIEGLNNLVLKPGDVVGMLGWAPENAKGVGTWWILGKLSNPGEFIADLTFYLGQVRFRSKNDYDQVYFGSDTDGDPLTILFYGDAASTRALTISNGNEIRIVDLQGHPLFANDTVAGAGMADPWIPYLISPTTAAQLSGTTYLPATSSASFVSMYRGFNPVYHPRVSYGIIVIASGTTEWQLIVNTGSGNVTVATGSGSSNGSFLVPGFGSTFTPGGVVEFVINARNTGGGTTHIGVDRLYGRQS